jgi:hypothetical protein
MKEAHRNSRRGRIWQNKWWSKVPVRFTVLNMTFVHKLMADSFPFNAFMFVCVFALLDRFSSGQSTVPHINWWHPSQAEV